jgi:hypothetical protein
MAQHGLEASIHKAVAIVAECARTTYSKNGKPGPSSRRSVRAAWSTYKPVAHLWTVYLLWQRQKALGEPKLLLNPEIPQGLHNFLSLAECFRRLGTTIFPHGRKEPVLDPIAAWRAPSALQLSFYQVTTPPLEPWTADIYKRYRVGGEYDPLPFFEAPEGNEGD